MKLIYQNELIDSLESAIADNDDAELTPTSGLQIDNDCGEITVTFQPVRPEWAYEFIAWTSRDEKFDWDAILETELFGFIEQNNEEFWIAVGEEFSLLDEENEFPSDCVLCADDCDDWTPTEWAKWGKEFIDCNPDFARKMI